MYHYTYNSQTEVTCWIFIRDDTFIMGRLCRVRLLHRIKGEIQLAEFCPWFESTNRIERFWRNLYRDRLFSCLFIKNNEWHIMGRLCRMRLLRYSPYNCPCSAAICERSEQSAAADEVGIVLRRSRHCSAVHYARLLEYS